MFILKFYIVDLLFDEWHGDGVSF